MLKYLIERKIEENKLKLWSLTANPLVHVQGQQVRPPTFLSTFKRSELDREQLIWSLSTLNIEKWVKVVIKRQKLFKRWKFLLKFSTSSQKKK